MDYTRTESLFVWVLAGVTLAGLVVNLIDPTQHWVFYITAPAAVLNCGLWWRVQRRQRRGAHRIDEARTDDQSTV